MRQFTRSCFLLLFLGRLFLLFLLLLLGTCLPFICTPPFPFHASTLLPLLSRQGAALAHLDSLPRHDLVFWTDGSLSFPFGKGGLAYLSTALCGTEATLSFSASPVCSSFSTEGCAILHALCWSRQHQQFCHFSSVFFLSDFRSVLATLSSTLSFLLSQSLWQIWQELFSLIVLSDCNESPDTRFSHGTTRLISWPDGERFSCPLQVYVVSFLLFVVSTLIFSRTGGVLSHKLSFTHRFPRFAPRNLCSLVTLAVFSLVFAAMDTAYLLGFYLSRIGRIENLSCSACRHSYQNPSSHSPLLRYGLFVLLALWRLTVSLRPLVQALGCCPASGAPWSCTILRKRSGNNRTIYKPVIFYSLNLTFIIYKNILYLTKLKSMFCISRGFIEQISILY